MPPHNVLSSSNRTQVLWLLGLIPFIIMHNISAVFIELRGVIPEQSGLAVLGYFLGLVSSALLLPTFEHNIAKGGGSSKVWSIALLVLLLLPGFFSFILPLVGENTYKGNSFINIFQPFLWALLLPVAFQLFFHPILNGLHGIFFGIVAAVGHLCWVLLIPIITLSASAPDTAESSYLPFLNTIRCIFGIAFALIAWWLMVHSGLRKEDNSCTSTPHPVGLGVFLLSLTVCFLLYGIMNTVVFTQFGLHTINLGYMNLGLALLLLLIGFGVTHYGNNVIKQLMVGAFVGVATAPLLLYLFPSSSLSALLHYVYVASYHVILFLGTLVCGYFTLQANRKVLSIAIVLPVLSSAIFGSFLAKRFFSELLLSPQFFVCFYAVLHIAIAIFIGRYFSLFKVLPTATDEVEKTPKKYNAEMIQTFSARHKLRGREIQIMEMLLQGLSTVEMVNLLGLKNSTIRTYTQTLLKKTGTTSRLGLVAAFWASNKDASVEL